MIRHSRCRLPVFMYYTLMVAIALMMTSGAESINLEKLSVMTGEYSGTFSSPGYPNSYPVNVTYTWVFPKYDHDVVLVKFVDMNLYLCYVVVLDEMCDIYDHVAVEGHLPFCNWRIPKGVLTLRERTVIKFRTFPSLKACRGRGFNASFKVVSSKIHGETTTTSLVSAFTDNTKEDSTNPDISKTAIVIIVATLIVVSVIFLILCVWCWKLKKRRLARRNRSRTRSYSSIPPQERERSDPQLQRDVVSYSELLRNEDQRIPSRAQGPPPCYESVINLGNSSQRENINLAAEFENPPSYETAVGERQASTQRTSRHASNVTNAPGISRGGQELNNTQSVTRNTPNNRNNTETTTEQTDNTGQTSPDQQGNVLETGNQSFSRNSRHRTHGNQHDESTNQTRVNSTSETTNDSNQVGNIPPEPSTDSQESRSRGIVTESSEGSVPDDSRREVFV